MEARLPNVKTIALAIGAAFSALSLQAQANPISVDARYSLGGGSEVTESTMTGSNVDYYLWKDAPGGNSVFFHTYGYESGSQANFGARSSGEGVFTAWSRVSYSTLVNISGTQAVNFDFRVDNSELSFYNAFIGQTGSARLELVISIDGNELTREDIRLDLASTGAITCTDAGSGQLDSYIECPPSALSSISQNSRDFSADLGLRSSDFTLQYDIIATVSGNMTGGTECSSYGEFVEDGYGNGAIQFGNVVEQQPQFAAATVDDEEPILIPVFGCSPGQAIARSGDPTDFSFANTGPQPLVIPANNTSPFAITQRAVDNPVPEPTTLALTGLALAGLAAARRRKPG
jgi:hypothetical protein